MLFSSNPLLFSQRRFAVLTSPMRNRFQLRHIYQAVLLGLLPITAALSQTSSTATLNSPAKSGSTATVAAQGGYAEQLNGKRKASSAATLYNQPYIPIKKPTDDGQIPEIEMFVGESRVFPAPGVGRIAVGNGSILTAAALDGKEVILFANAIGTSSLFIWNEDGRYQRVKINIVPGDTSRFAREIAAFLTSIPKAKASIIGDKVIVEGDDLSDADLGRIELLTARYPQIVNFTNRLGFEQMVMLDVKVVEFPVTELRELGLKWNATGGFAAGAIWSPIKRGDGSGYQIELRTGQDNPPPISGGQGSTSTPLTSGLKVLSVLNMGLNATLNALAQEGKTTILAEPQLSARNGSKASFLAGGEYPYSVSTINGPTIQFKPYGVKLDVQPRVDRNGNIRATVETEISSIDNSVSTASGPGLLTNKTSTEFNVRNGETIVLSGMLQRTNSNTVDKVPGLGDIPILGALFRSKRYQNKETELVFFVTPTVIDAKSPGVVDRIQKTNERLQERLGPVPNLTDPLQPGVDPARLDRPVPISKTNDLNTGSRQVGIQQATQTIEPSTVAQIEPAKVTLVDSSTLLPTSFESPQGSTLRVKADAATIYSQPNSKSVALLQLGRDSVVTLRADVAPNAIQNQWRPVQVGSVVGWVDGQTVEPTKLQTDIKEVSSKPAVMAKPSAVALGKDLPKPVAQSLTLGDSEAKGRYTTLLARLAMRTNPDVNAPIVRNLQLGQVVQGLKVQSIGAWTAIEADGQRGWVATQWLQPVVAAN
jgi:pilus assembly protein CpaC